MSCRRWMVFALVLVTCLTARGADAQFRKGILKQTFEVTLSRKRAPQVYLLGTAIRVDATATTPALAPAAKQIAELLEAGLPSNDSRLTPVKDRPETIIAVSLVQVDSTRANETRQVMVSRQTGTKNGKAVYSLVPENQMFVVVTGRLSATFQVRDVNNGGAVLASDTLSPSYKKEYLNGAGVPEPAALQLDMLGVIANQIAARVTPTIEPVTVLLARPTDEIDELNKLAQKNLWNLMLERLDLVKPIADKKKDAYRLYNLGVANEAMAYAAGDMETSKRLLEKASSYYSQAIESNDDEKNFRDPQTRIAEAINGYTTLQAQMVKYQELKASAAAAATAAAPANGAAPVNAGGSRNLSAPTASTYTNASVIKFVADGLDEANTIEFVKDAPSVSFDFSPAGVQALLQGKVSNKIIAAMRARQNAKPAPPRAASRPGATTEPPKPAADATPRPPVPPKPTPTPTAKPAPAPTANPAPANPAKPAAK